MYRDHLTECHISKSMQLQSPFRLNDLALSEDSNVLIDMPPLEEVPKDEEAKTHEAEHSYAVVQEGLKEILTKI